MTDDPAAGHNGHARPATSAAQQLLEDAKELVTYARYYANARADKVKASVRRAGLLAALGAGGAIVGVALLCTAAVLLLAGLADGLSRLAGTGPWLGELCVGILVLGGAALGAWIVYRRITSRSRDATIKRYEHLRHDQRQRFGHDVVDRAVEARSRQ